MPDSPFPTVAPRVKFATYKWYYGEFRLLLSRLDRLRFSLSSDDTFAAASWFSISLRPKDGQRLSKPGGCYAGLPPPGLIYKRKITGLPGSWINPVSTCPALRPRFGRTYHRRSIHQNAAFRPLDAVGFQTTIQISRLNHAAYRLDPIEFDIVPLDTHARCSLPAC